MRKLISFGLLFLLAWQIIGFVGFFEFSRYHLKKEIKLLLKEGVPKDELVFFEFDDKQMNALIWLKKNEFDLNGNLFDVVRKRELPNGKIHLECISDERETILFKKLNQSIASNLSDESQHSPISCWIKILHFPIILENCEWYELNFTAVTIPHSNFNYQSSNSTKAVDIHSPPPKFS